MPAFHVHSGGTAKGETFMRRSMLFLPGNTPNIIINGDALGADCIILDL